MPRVRPLAPGDERLVRAFLLESAALYPGIGRWFDRKALPGLRAGARIGFVLEEGNSLAGLLIARRGKRAKLCSLRVREPFRHRGWGPALVKRALADLTRGGTEEMYVTVSEAVDPRDRQFFEGLGFARCGTSKDKYVKGVDEFVYAWAMPEMMSFLRHPSASSPGAQATTRAASLPDMIMSLKPQYAQMFLGGRKSVEFRRRFSRRHVGARVLFYVSRPARAFMFTAKILAVEQSTTEQLWAAHYAEGGIDRRTFDSYFRGSGAGYAVKLSDIERLRRDIPLADALKRCPELRPPQSYKMVKDTPAFAALWHDGLL